MEWLLGDLRTPRTVEDMARQAGLSRRHFIRRFQEQTGSGVHVDSRQPAHTCMSTNGYVRLAR
ncbi:AraC family transcriptional regulator [Promicromonospora sp. AC04]|uniref:AraC family transcriptional regulator n=1 Tax=Promicromonospora sp. AC04 TaxID=2135723 RepID=UPI000D34B8DB